MSFLNSAGLGTPTTAKTTDDLPEEEASERSYFPERKVYTPAPGEPSGRPYGPENPVLNLSLTSASRHSLVWKKQRIVAIPVCNEEDYIVPCLLALAAQKYKADKVILWINNTTDDTCLRARSLIDQLPFELETVTVFYDAALASAGLARRDAMAHAARAASSDAILFTTDADSEVASDWIESILAAFVRYPVDAVFGRVLLLPDEYKKIPAHLHEDEQAEQAYGALLEQIALLLNPEPYDPWPRHLEHSGASIAVTHQAWSKVGGIPHIPSGEDRGFYQALRQNGIPVRHALDVKVYVSARLQGRAQGGMAETLARRLIAQDECIDDIFEPVSRRLLRIRKELKYLRESRLSMSNQPYPELPVIRIRRNELQRHHERAERVLNFLSIVKHRVPENLQSATADQYDTPRLALTGQGASVFHDRPE
ncbi:MULTISPECIES: glycosyltransferase family 2 protein [unclassified Gluconobacter]|uniref:glycosyltransferase n=1 Tax=unclassified Gluconobacter TaxID=2644261 RepID=UPI001C05EAD2|nr:MULTISPECIES: glycosyltransferase [unclassified Gluconobacter]